MKSQFRQRLLASTLLVGAAAFAAPAWAQPVDEDDQENAVDLTIDPDQVDADVDAGTIIVTGSRIPRRDLVSTSPLAVIQDEEFKLSGTVNVEQVINTLPQVVPGFTAFSNNPGTGAATANLRGLGSSRTLILVNGRRYIFFDTAQLVDINTIPAFLLDSVDVITGGASAVYGSDAIAGVINFRLQEDLTGITAGGGYRITEEGDGARKNVYMALGSEIADGRGHVTAFGEYFERESIFQGDRPFSRFAATENCIVPGSTDDETGVGEAVSVRGPDTPESCQAAGAEFGLTAGGSSTPPFGRFRDFFGTTGGEFTPGGRVFDVAGGNTRPAVQPQDLYNYAPANFLQLPQERFLLGGYGAYEISPAINAFIEATFINNRVEQELAATPVTGFFDVNVDAIGQFLNATELARFRRAAAASGDPNVIEDLFIQRRTTDVGARNSLDERNAFRLLGGVKGPAFDLGRGPWTYEAYYSYARTRNANVQEGNISRSAFQAGLDGTDAPLNIFGPDTLTPDAADQIGILAQNNDISVLQVANAALAGSLFNFGLGGQDIGAAVGVEYRKVGSRFIPDTALSSGDVIGFNAANPTEGGYDVKEAFGELRIPIIADRPFFYRLDVNGAYRYSDYSLPGVGSTQAYAAGVEFAPVRDIAFRAQFQRAVRAPNVGELFSGGGIGFPGAVDPCSTAAALTGRIREICLAQGVPAATVGTPGIQLNEQIPSTFGGNPDLTEETSDTFTAGAVFRPRFIPRLTMTVDYFDIEIEDAIGAIGTSTVFDLCFGLSPGTTPDPAFCDLINRNPAGIISGEEFNVSTLARNIASLTARGVDFQVDYNMPLRFSMTGAAESRASFFFLGTWTDISNFTPIAEQPDGEVECAGKFGGSCGEPTPEFKWTSRLSLQDGPMTTSVRWRHLSSVEEEDEENDFFVEEIDAYNVFDLSFSFDIADNYTFAVGVNNIFDKKPDVLGDNQEQGNTFPSTFDVLGRDYFATVNFRF
jgi:outer membrane receptor protein involved in Fe transport